MAKKKNDVIILKVGELVEFDDIQVPCTNSTFAETTPSVTRGANGKAAAARVKARKKKPAPRRKS